MRIVIGDPHSFHPLGPMSLFAPKSGKALCDLFYTYRPQLWSILLQLLKDTTHISCARWVGGFIAKPPQVLLSRGLYHQLPEFAT